MSIALAGFGVEAVGGSLSSGKGQVKCLSAFVSEGEGLGGVEHTAQGQLPFSVCHVCTSLNSFTRSVAYAPGSPVDKAGLIFVFNY